MNHAPECFYLLLSQMSPFYMLYIADKPCSVFPEETSDGALCLPSSTSRLRDIMDLLPVHISTLLLLSLLLLLRPCSSIRPQVLERASDPQQPQLSGNATGPDKKCAGKVVCKPGILLPVWLPLNPPWGEQAGRAVIYFLSLMYIFLGVSIIADRFMASIEVITSQVLLDFIFQSFSHI